MIAYFCILICSKLESLSFLYIILDLLFFKNAYQSILTLQPLNNYANQKSLSMHASQVFSLGFMLNHMSANYCSQIFISLSLLYMFSDCNFPHTHNMTSKKLTLNFILEKSFMSSFVLDMFRQIYPPAFSTTILCHIRACTFLLTPRLLVFVTQITHDAFFSPVCHTEFSFIIRLSLDILYLSVPREHGFIIHCAFQLLPTARSLPHVNAVWYAYAYQLNVVFVTRFQETYGNLSHEHVFPVNNSLFNSCLCTSEYG